MTSRRTYDRAFKLQAIELIKTSEKSINEIARDLGITPGLLHKWKARMKVDGKQAFPGKGHLKEDDELTQEALEMAILQRRPPDQLLHHAEACGHVPFRATST